MSSIQTPAESYPTVYRSLAAAARRIPSFRNAKTTHTSTMTRRVTKGIRLQDGTVLKLAAKRFPGGWGVSDQAVNEFIDALTRDRCGEPVMALPRARHPPAPATSRGPSASWSS